MCPCNPSEACACSCMFLWGDWTAAGAALCRLRLGAASSLVEGGADPLGGEANAPLPASLRRSMLLAGSMTRVGLRLAAGCSAAALPACLAPVLREASASTCCAGETKALTALPGRPWLVLVCSGVCSGRRSAAAIVERIALVLASLARKRLRSSCSQYSVSKEFAANSPPTLTCRLSPLLDGLSAWKHSCQHPVNSHKLNTYT